MSEVVENTKQPALQRAETAAPAQGKKIAWRGIMGQIAAACGDDVALALMENLSGVRFYVPKKPKPDAILSFLTEDQAARFVAEYSGLFVYIPSNLRDKPTSLETFNAIEALIEEGYNTNEVASRLQISQTYVFQLRKDFGAPKIRDIRKRQKAHQMESNPT